MNLQFRAQIFSCVTPSYVSKSLDKLMCTILLLFRGNRFRIDRTHFGMPGVCRMFRSN